MRALRQDFRSRSDEDGFEGRDLSAIGRTAASNEGSSESSTFIFASFAWCRAWGSHQGREARHRHVQLRGGGERDHVLRSVRKVDSEDVALRTSGRREHVREAVRERVELSVGPPVAEIDERRAVTGVVACSSTYAAKFFGGSSGRAPSRGRGRGRSGATGGGAWSSCGSWSRARSWPAPKRM